MKIGRLRHRVTIMQDVVTEDGKGGSTTSWEQLDKVWANVKGQRGNESEIGEQSQSVTNYDVEMRERSDVRASMRLEWGDRTLNILSVIHLPQGRMMLPCRDISDEGQIEVVVGS